jgi:hypothetical protein
MGMEASRWLDANDGQVHVLPVRGRISMLLGAGR